MELAENSNPPNKQHVRWGPVAAVIVTVIIYFFSQILAGLFVALVPRFFWSGEQVDEWLSESIFAQFTTVVAVATATVWMLAMFLRSNQATWRTIGLVRPQKRDIGYALGGFGVYFAATIVILPIVLALLPGIDANQPQELGFDTGIAGPLLGLVFASLVIVPAIVEELVTRGFLYTGLRTKLSKLTAALITSSMFAAAHLQFGSGNRLLWVAAIDTFVLSLVLVYLRDRTGSLWPPIAVHLLKNSVAFTYLFIFKVI